MITVVLKKINVDEHDQLVTCYSSELGKSTLIAKSVLRPTSKQSLHLDILNLVEFSPIEGKNKLIITGADSVETFNNIKRSIKKLGISFIVLEVFDKLVPYGETDNNLWDFLLRFLYSLNNVEASELTQFVSDTKKGISEVLGYGERDIENLFSDVWGKRMYSIKFAKRLSPDF